MEKLGGRDQRVEPATSKRANHLAHEGSPPLQVGCSTVKL